MKIKSILLLKPSLSILFIPWTIHQTWAEWGMEVYHTPFMPMNSTDSFPYLSVGQPPSEAYL